MDNYPQLRPNRLSLANTYWCICENTNSFSWKPHFSILLDCNHASVDWGLWVLAISFDGQMMGRRNKD